MIRNLVRRFQELERETEFIALADEQDASVWTVGVTPAILTGAGLGSLSAQLSDWALHVNELELLQLEFRFPKRFPSDPPFVRVLKPRFIMHTGHITVGGSICADFLTTHQWDPTLSLEAVLRSVLDLMLQGGARFDFCNKQSYTLAEANDAFKRMMQVHGWQ
jgi:ubiquitin-conjugating enzyme E2 Q